jgi:allantoin racemase
MLIELGEFYPGEIATKEQYAKSVCFPGTTPVLTLIKAPSSLPDNFSRFGLYVPGILQKIKEAEQEEYDAVMVDCFTDSGVELAKIAANIPIVGPAESSLHLSCLLADKFGWITPMDEGVVFHWRQVNTLGLADKITSIKALNISLLDIYKNKSLAGEKITELARGLVQQGAQLILIGCTGILPALGTGSANKLSRILGVTVIDPFAVALKTAEMLVSLNLRQSKIAFPETANFE